MWRFIRSFGLHEIFVLVSALGAVLALEAAKDQPVWQREAELAAVFSRRDAGAAPEPAAKPTTEAVPSIPSNPAPDQTAPLGKSWPDGGKYFPNVYYSAPVSTPVSELNLTPEQKRVYRADFTGLDYYGAFAVAPDGSYGWASGYANPWFARASAVALCERGSSHCRVVAEIRPKGQSSDPAPSSETLTSAQAHGLMWVRNGTGARAFARGLDGSWGAMTASTADSAAAGALKNCWAMAGGNSAPLPAACKVVAVWND